MSLLFFLSALPTLPFLQVINFLVFWCILCLFLFPKLTDLCMFSYFFFLNTKHFVCFALCFFPLLDRSCTSILLTEIFLFFFFFLNSCMIFCCMCSSLCNHSPMFEHLGSFQHFEVTINAAVSSFLCMYFPVVKIYLQSKLLEARFAEMEGK